MAQTKHSKKRSKKTRPRGKSHRLAASLLLAVLDELNELAGLLRGGPRLVGEINATDNLPLRDAMGRSDHCISIEAWHSQDASWLRSAIARSGLFDTWLEVSAVRSQGSVRRVFWGIR